jgi:ADP-heptose:LPS heptosyltransferase
MLMEERRQCTNKYVLSQVVWGGVKKLRKFLAASAEDAARDEKAFVDEIVNQFVLSCRNSGVAPRELFESLLLWGEELARLSLLNEALRYFGEALDLGVGRYPDLYSQALVGKAGVLNTLGKFPEAQEVLSSLAERPYIISDRNFLPEIVFNLCKESILKGDIAYYKKLLFRGLRHFYTNLDTRRVFLDQIQKTYRHSYSVLLDSQVRFQDKFLFVLHWMYFRLLTVRLARLTQITGAVKLVVLGYVYCLNYFRRGTLIDESPCPAAVGQIIPVTRRNNGSRPHPGPTTRRKKHILVTRAMGGIGDLLMMTPGIHALRRRYPDEEIHLALPKRFFPLFLGNSDVTLLDIESNGLDHASYRKWYNLTDCPAARVESRTAPRVRRSRQDIFASALGIGPIRRRSMDRRPRYFVTEDEAAFQTAFWKAHGLEGKTVVGVQLRSDEVYRDYPHMRQLIQAISQDKHVMVFDAEEIQGLNGANIVKIGGLGIRQAFALLSGCDAVVAPDSAFVHLAGAFDLPCVALYGPIDGRVRTKHYPRCKFLDVRNTLGCLPCWRNDRIPCKLTNMRTSICMADISIQRVLGALDEVIRWKA